MRLRNLLPGLVMLHLAESVSEPGHRSGLETTDPDVFLLQPLAQAISDPGQVSYLGNDGSSVRIDYAGIPFEGPEPMMDPMPNNVARGASPASPFNNLQANWPLVEKNDATAWIVKCGHGLVMMIPLEGTDPKASESRMRSRGFARYNDSDRDGIWFLENNFVNRDTGFPLVKGEKGDRLLKIGHDLYMLLREDPGNQQATEAQLKANGYSRYNDEDNIWFLPGKFLNPDTGLLVNEEHKVDLFVQIGVNVFMLIAADPKDQEAVKAAENKYKHRGYHRFNNVSNLWYWRGWWTTKRVF